MQDAILKLKLERQERREILRFVDDNKNDEVEILSAIFRPHEFNEAKTVENPTETQDDEPQEKENENGVVYLTDKEIKTMPKKIQRIIILDGKRCRIRTRQSGKDSTTYQIRFRRDGYDVNACGVTVNLAKQNFLEKIKTAQPKAEKDKNIIPVTFHSFAMYYFENFRKEKVSELTMKTDMPRYEKYLKPALQEKSIKNITPSDCKKILDDVKKQGKGKTADELYGLLSVIFKSAIAHGIIERSPLSIVQHTKHERENGTALTRAEEDCLLKSITEPAFLVATAIALYCGLRPNELATAKINGDFIIAINSKRKGRKVEYKKIPIIKRLRPFIKDGIPELPTPQLLRRRISAALPNHKLYDLRTTFYTRCKECGVSEHALKEYAGHSLGALGNAYTDLSDEYLLKEGKKLDNW